jgi:hypothetical protein
MRPFTVAKFSVWLCRKNATVFEAASLVALKSATVSYFTLLSSSPYNSAHKKHKGYINLLFPILWED